jgi:DNA-binding protein Fis
MFVQRLASSHDENLFDSLIDDTASIVISEALNLTGGNRSRAAKLLGLSRPTLQAKIEKYRLKIETSVSSS